MTRWKEGGGSRTCRSGLKIQARSRTDARHAGPEFIRPGDREEERSDTETSSDASRSPGETQRRGASFLFSSLLFSGLRNSVDSDTRSARAETCTPSDFVNRGANTHSWLTRVRAPKTVEVLLDGREDQICISLARIPRHLTAAGRSPCSSEAKGTRARARGHALSPCHFRRRPGGRDMESRARNLGERPTSLVRARVVETTRGASSFCVLKRPSARRGPGIVSVDRNVRSKCRCSCVLQFTS